MVMDTAMGRKIKTIRLGRNVGRRSREIGWDYLIISSKSKNEGKLVVSL
jgi:hypothetical protein